MKRYEELQKRIKTARNSGEVKKVITLFLMQYSKNLISRMDKPEYIAEWLERSVTE